MRLRLKKVLLLAAVVIIFFMSVKILTSHGFAKHRSKKAEKSDALEPNVHENLDIVGIQKLSRSEVVKSLVEKYKVDWNYKLIGSPWSVAASWVSENHVLPPFTPELGGVLNAMATREIISADVGYKGTQLKMLLVLEGGQKVVFKPKRFTRDHVIEGTPYAGEDRHNGEIAAFHLSRLLDFRLTPIAVGRTVNLVQQIKPVATSTLLTTFYSKDGNTCFYGKCLYCKGEETGVCGDGELLEGAVLLWLPPRVTLTLNKHPWARTYRRGMKALWEEDDNYCKKIVLQHPEYVTGPRLLDLVDTAILDFLVGNADRHHYETMGEESKAKMLMLDNGKSFGNPHLDEMSVLAPLYHCCRLRQSTWTQMLQYQGGLLSEVLQLVMSADPISPVISEQHLQAIDRRLDVVIQTVNQCVEKYNAKYVFIDDR